MTQPYQPQVSRYRTGSGALIYTLPVRVFGEMTANIYLLRRGDDLALIDTGSGSDTSNTDLLTALAAANHLFDETLALQNLSRIVVTHGHIDHYGGLDFVCSQSSAPVAIHAQDAAALGHHHERRLRHRRALHHFAHAAGIPEEVWQSWLRLDKESTFRGRQPDTLLEDGDVLDGLLRVIHVPGHCPGQVALRLDEVLLSADQLLAHTTPHLLPESMLPGCGLELYLASLRRLEAETGVTLSLGGHEAPITDLGARTQALRGSYGRKLARILEHCTQPQTVYQLYVLLYPRLQGQNQILALEKVGAMVEYLHTRGHLLLDNLDELARDPEALAYYRRAGSSRAGYRIMPRLVQSVRV